MLDPHKEWLGLLQPVGLVVSPLALNEKQAHIDRTKAVQLQQRLSEVISPEPLPGDPTEGAWIPDFALFTQQVLDWLPEDLQEPPPDCEVVLPEYGETLRPTYALQDPDSQEWVMLVQTLPPGRPLDQVAPETDSQGWQATVQAKFERLLRETQIPTGLLWNGIEIRLIYAPRGESSGYITFPVQAMTEVSGRLILGALELLIGSDRLFNVPSDRRLSRILSDSRAYQAQVSITLAGQVLDALWELLRGFQAADATSNGALLPLVEQEEQKENYTYLYGGLITTLMRLVFLLYAEDEGLMPDDSIYQQNYAVSALYERLREDAQNYPDTMEQRYGAWAWLLSLFRLVYDGGGAPGYLPARHGQLFDPNEYPFLEGRSPQPIPHSPSPIPYSLFPKTHSPSPIPHSPFPKTHSPFPKTHSLKPIPQTPPIADGVIYRILDKLLILNGERISYRALDVEQIGSVYEAIMGYEVEKAAGVSIGVRAKDKDIVINLEDILAAPAKDRAKQLKEAADSQVSGNALTALKSAQTPEDIAAALERRLSHRTPNLLPPGSLYLQPGEERRSSGSHYTPRQLTQPIVEATLRPVLEALGPHPTPEQILSLKVCDLAMGSGAFLVEACRQLAERLVAAWEYHPQPIPLALSEVEGHSPIPPSPHPPIPPSPTVEPLLLARRLVAGRCLYGVDKNPFAVNLAKLSLWLITLAKDRPFTFVDHALKWGDSLVGLTSAEIGQFTKSAQLSLFEGGVKHRLTEVKTRREMIQNTDTAADEDEQVKRRSWEEIEGLLEGVRLAGAVKIAAFFQGSKAKERQQLEQEYQTLFAQGTVEDLEQIAARLSEGQRPVTPFNWQVEFPEVFERQNPGFDAIVGNPPFAGKNTTINANPEGYLDWLKVVHPESHGNSDLVAHFFRRAFTLIRKQGTLGLIATNTIAQGDTRTSGLRFICHHGGTIYEAQKRFKWPGVAAVVVSLIHILKGKYEQAKTLDGHKVDQITAFLFHAGGHDDPQVLVANRDKSFIGSIVLGMGFTFDDSNPDATPIEEMHRLIAKDPRNGERIFPYIGGEEVNSSPTHDHHRYVINFGEMSEEEARQWPDLMAIVEEKVKPARLAQKREIRARYWWRFGETTPALVKAIAKCDRVLVIPCAATKYLGFTFLPTNMVFSHKLVVFPLTYYSDFCTLQSRIHEIWSIFFSATLEDRLTYNPSDCFETFPFPEGLTLREVEGWTPDPTLEAAGKTYYEYRADLMVRHNQGLTATYNRFHNPDEHDPDILHLRDLHAEMDRAVLNAYGWSDVDPTCGFALDYLDTTDEDNTLPPDLQERIASGDLYFPTAEEAITFDSYVRTGRRKLPWRYRWPNSTHDEVLARLLNLNQSCHQSEVLGGQTAQPQKKRKQPPSQPTIPGI